MIDLCFGAIFLYSSQDNELTEFNRIELMQTANSLLMAVFKDDENLFFYNDRLMRSHFEISAMYAKVGEYSNSLKNILICEKYAIACDNLKNAERKKSTSLLTNRITFDSKNMGRNWEGKWKHFLLRMIENNPHMDKLKDNKDFTTLIKRLKTL